MAKEIKEIVRIRAPTHKKYYVTRIEGGLTSQDFRFELMNEKMKNEKGDEVYISDALIILNPIGAKRLFTKLKESIKEYESENGEISLDLKNEKYV